jgi:predicted RND superfamily exporter protein
MRPRPHHRIPESHWRRLDVEERRLIAAHIDNLICKQYKNQIALVTARAWINRVYELVPSPVLFAALVAFFSFVSLFVLPTQPVSMFVSLSLGIVLALVVKVLLLVSARVT